ncbi:MAG: hypothetical protein RID42_00365 [Alphaproteobacteria bacterium]
MASHARSRLARARRARRKNRDLRPEIAPTPQTVARLLPDPLWTLLQRGRLTQEQVDAAHDIRTAFEIITGPVRLRTMRAVSTVDGAVYDLTRGSRGRTGNSDSDRAILLQQRFNAWVAVMKRLAVPVGPIIDIVVEGQACRSVDRTRGRRNGWSTEILECGLDLYIAAKRPPRRGRSDVAGDKKIPGDRERDRGDSDCDFPLGTANARLRSHSNKT